MKYLLGIDVGTTGTKTLLLRQDGKLCGQAYQGYATHTPAVGRCEQNPEDWWQAVIQTVRQVVTEEKIARNVAGISLSVQGGTLIPVDADFQPVHPAIVWNDIRCAEENKAWLEQFGTDDAIYRKTGWHLIPGLSAMQIRHMGQQEKVCFDKTVMFLSVPDYIAYRMTGKPVLDMSNVGINQLGSVTEGAYDPDILQFAGISEEQLPAILPAGSVVGKLTEKAAEELGLTTDTVLVNGVHDQYAVALGAGACHAGDILIGSGTCWVVTCIADEPDFDSGLSQSVAAVPGKWGSLWSLSSGGVCLEWMRKLTGGDSYDTINQQVASRRAAEDGLFFFPFSGRADQQTQFNKGSFVGLDLSHDRFHLTRAVMEGVAFQTVWKLREFAAKPNETGVILAGGASKSEVWCQMVADMANLPVRIPEVADLACVGAAILAGAGSGVYGDLKEGCRTFTVKERVIMPDPQNVARYQPLMETYKRYAQKLGQAYQQEDSNPAG